MKVLVPVAGVGTRLRPHTYTQPKPLIPVAGKPIISYTIDQLVEEGIKDFVFVIGYLGDKIRDYISEAHPEINMELVYQAERQGLGHAVWTAREALKGCEEVFIVLGDTIFDIDFKRFLNEPHSCLGVKKVEDPRNFGVASFGSDFIVTKVVEKPNIPMSNSALVGLYKCKEVSALLDSLNYLIENNLRSVGEFQLTDALMIMIEKGVLFKALEINRWFDCGKKEILLETNAILLKKLESKGQKSYAFENSIIIHPVHIGKDCKISNSIIGPNVTIGEHVNIDYSIVKSSIIGNYATIKEVVLEHSVVGSDASIKGLSQSLNIGDNTEIDFG